MDSFKYKHFLLRAFIAPNQKVTGNYDLAKLATQDIYEDAFNPHELNLLKIGTGYAMEIFYRRIEDASDTNNVDYEELKDMKRIINDVISAQMRKEVSNLIDEFMVYELKYLHKKEE